METDRIRPEVAVLELQDGSIQFGTSIEHSLLVTGLTQADREWIQELDSARPQQPRTVTQRRLFAALQHSGLLATGRPAPLRIRIVGLNRVGVITATALALDGTIHLDLRDGRPVDAHVEQLFADDMKGVARDQALRAWASTKRISGSRLSSPQLAISFESMVADWNLAARLLAADVPHLPVLVGDREVNIGPLTVPGRTACFQCVELSRQELIPEWRTISTKLRQLPAREPNYALASFAGGLTASVVQSLREPANRKADWYAGKSWTVTETAVRETYWEMRPDCGCSGFVKVHANPCPPS